ncbi:hypothetical protein G9A89_018050 [Geosiphon pyriformis]|nr:hypothetical protein G9A89_018050 [Geosiphon pyriformis]
MIYTIPEENEPINNCASESESVFNPDSNSDNDNDKNNGSSSVQNDHENYNNSNSDSNPETYIVLPDLSKEQKLRWFSDNNEESHLHTCIDLKIALEISATTMIQLAFRSSLAKKGINIKGEIIDTGYVKNIIAMLQNDSKKTYTIDLNEKITQAIFLLLVKIAQLVLVRNREKLGITIRGIQGFGLMDRIDIPVNMAKEKIIDKGEIISTHQPISIPLYNKYMVIIERKMKDQIQIFEAEAKLCKSGKIGLVNLYIPTKNHSHIKISIYNNTEDIIKIPEGITIGHLTTKIEDQLSDTISDFLQLCGYMKKMLFALTRTIETDELEKLRPTLTDTTQDIQELFDAFREKKWFSTLDLDSGYWQVAMKPEDKEKMAFTT